MPPIKKRSARQTANKSTTSGSSLTITKTIIEEVDPTLTLTLTTPPPSTSSETLTMAEIPQDVAQSSIRDEDSSSSSKEENQTSDYEGEVPELEPLTEEGLL
ncbi:uncharacterized protein LOC141852312 [Brevipalpus obovatus]|uniref:uncharacterized protein LOC141852312 n=1 Tax=Brevipalpus obovatus TaxID=246614 RepID=UPI003D9E434D